MLETLNTQAPTLRDPTQFLFEQLDTVAAGGGLVLAGGDFGVFASRDGGVKWDLQSKTEFTETVDLPSTWLFVSGTHELSVQSEGGPSS